MSTCHAPGLAAVGRPITRRPPSASSSSTAPSLPRRSPKTSSPATHRTHPLRQLRRDSFDSFALGRARRIHGASRGVALSSSVAVAEPRISWADGEGRFEDGGVVAEAAVVNLGPRGDIATGLPFLDHMVDQLTSHCQLGVSVVVTKDGVRCEPCVDASGEDDLVVATAAGKALGEALKQMLAPGVVALEAGEVPRDASCGVFSAPLDEAYSTCRLTVGPNDGGSLAFALAPYGPGAGRAKIGKYQTALTEPFWRAVVESSGLGLDLRKHRGDNAHHIVEATFKSFARCLRATMDQMEGIDVVSANEPAPGPRSASRARSTKETTIDVTLDLDGDAAASAVSTGIATLDGLLREVAAEGGVDLRVDATGDLWIDDHHTTEDVAITVGQVLNEALGNKAGCNRMGRAVAAVAEGRDAEEGAEGAATVEVVMDLSNRPYLANGLEFRDEFIGDLSAEMIDHLFMSIAANGQMTVHVVAHGNGANDADLATAAARAFGRCLRQCIAVDPRRAGAVASSKGTLSV